MSGPQPPRRVEVDTEPTVRSGWLTYADELVPPDAPPVQMQETRRAFYAGARHLFTILEAIGDDAVSEDAGAAILELLSQELQRFAGDVEGGRA